MTTTETRRLYRSLSQRMIGGVCGGLGEYLAIDSTLIRVLFVLATLFGGHGILLYLILLILVPVEPGSQVPAN
ncbi:MAG: PspC domain-containing protein [Chloroflexi bacterium]|nr:PspC domain-containing protein [Chloroflexota bacterium]